MVCTPAEGLLNSPTCGGATIHHFGNRLKVSLQSFKLSELQRLGAEVNLQNTQRGRVMGRHRKLEPTLLNLKQFP